MRCKIVRTEMLMSRNIMKLTKSQKASVLHYSIDILEYQTKKKKTLYYVIKSSIEPRAGSLVIFRSYTSFVYCLSVYPNGNWNIGLVVWADHCNN